MGGVAIHPASTMLCMGNESGIGPRTYQRLLIDEANAEMGRQRISRRELARVTGIPRTTMDRLFQCERDMNVTQWDAIAHALGFDPGVLARRAHGEVMPPARDHDMPPSGGDVRTLIQWLLDHPARDEELNTRLSEAGVPIADSGSRNGNLRETICELRRDELERALNALPPTAQGRKAN